MIRLSQIKGVGVGFSFTHFVLSATRKVCWFYNEVHRMDNLLGLGAKSVCGFFTHKFKMTSKMATKPSLF